MGDGAYITLVEASKLADLQSSDSLHAAARTGRLKTVTTAAGPRPMRLTTRVWLQEYLDSQRREA